MLTQNQIDIIIETMKPFDPVMIGVFGSFARDEETEESDIDIVFSFARDYSLFDLGGLFSDLKEALHKKVDVVPLVNMYDHVKACALPDLKIIYEDMSNEPKRKRMRQVKMVIEKSKSPGYKQKSFDAANRRLEEEAIAVKKEIEKIKRRKIGGRGERKRSD